MYPFQDCKQSIKYEGKSLSIIFEENFAVTKLHVKDINDFEYDDDANESLNRDIIFLEKYG